jgi:aspartyl-tRNA(Asn)/glutamyl-tRNA(Gln) amidotransferase subunit B
VTWECVVGVEVHVQLRTDRKLFCLDRAVFGDEPNGHVCPVCLGLPGALPTANADAVRLAVMTALALDCRVHAESIWARKNYFYPDLPKGYQITQFERPLATDGHVDFDSADGPSRVRIRRVHMEEDAGKSVHDRVPGATAVDLNRAGTPLVEIVTEPDLRSPADVRAFLSDLKRLLEYTDVSDCSMEQGSLRADANVSLRPAGATALGTKTEIKNVNSFSGIERALEIEVARQTAVLDAGRRVRPETLLWDDHRGALRPMRSKEESHDYRYFPDPDLPPLILTDQLLAAARSGIPELPRVRRERFTREYALSGYDAGVLTQSRATADYFEEVARTTSESKLAANWVMGGVQALMNARGEDAGTFPVRPATLADLIGLVASGTISDGVARTVLEAVADGEGSPREIVAARGLEQIRDQARLEAWIEEVIDAHPDESARYRDGETRLLGFLVGQVMRRSSGKADPRQVNDLLRDRLG